MDKRWVQILINGQIRDDVVSLQGAYAEDGTAVLGLELLSGPNPKALESEGSFLIVYTAPGGQQNYAHFKVCVFQFIRHDTDFDQDPPVTALYRAICPLGSLEVFHADGRMYTGDKLSGILDLFNV